MKTSSTLFALLFAAMIITLTHSAQAQWATQNSGTTDTLLSVFCIDVNNCYAVSPMLTDPVILHTTNGGLDWNAVFAGLFFFPASIFFTDANNGYISGYDTIYKTSDAGATWSKYIIGTVPWVGMTIYFYNSTVGYAAGYNYISGIATIYHTTDAGVTWTASTSGGTCADRGSRCISCTNPSTCYNVGGHNGGNNGVNKTTDGGVTWNNIYNPPEDLISVYFISSSTGFITGGADGMTRKIYRTTDGGSSWNPVYTGPDGYINSIYFTNANTGYAVGNGGNILKTFDGGSTWNAMTSPTTKDLFGLHFPAANTGYAVGYSGTIIKYGGTTGIWEPIDIENEISIYPNPVKDNLTLQFNDADIKNAEIQIYNLLGEKVYSEKISGTVNRINTINLKAESGIYFMKIISDETSLRTAKIIIE